MIYREAVRDDCVQIRKLIQELADFEKMHDGPEIDAKVLERDGFDTNPPCFGCFVAELEDNEVEKTTESSIKNRIVGFALYNYAYATWTGKKLYLEDICVTERYRRKGIGKALFLKVVKKAEETGCAQIEFLVLTWNPAEDFYKKLGCVNITDTEDWNVYRLHKANMIKLLNNSETQ